MKFAIVLLVALFAVAAYARPGNDAQIEKFESDVRPDGYDFASKTSDGTEHFSSANLKNVGTDHESISVHGEFSYVAPDGNLFIVKYTADENGYQPEGEHLPKNSY